MTEANNETLIARLDQLEKNDTQMIETHNNLANLVVSMQQEFRMWLEAIPWALSKHLPDVFPSANGQPFNLYAHFNTEIVQPALEEARKEAGKVEYVVQEVANTVKEVL